MARLENAIDIASVDRSADQPMELLPFGDYLLELTAIEQKREGNSISHAYTYEVIEPEQFKKRRIWDWIDLQAEAGLEWKVSKGEARLANLCDSIGWDSATEGPLDDDEKIMFRSFMAKVVQLPGGVAKGTGKTFKPKNVVDRFYKPDDADAPSGASIAADQPKVASAPAAANDNKPAASQAAPAAAAGAKKTPWGAKK